MNDVVSLASAIQTKINILMDARNKIQGMGRSKAETIAAYDKQMALTIMRIKNGLEVVIGDEAIKNPPAILIDKIAKGVCYQAKLDMELADTNYKSLMTFIDTVCAELNALQSLNRHLD